MTRMPPENVTHILIHNSDSAWGDVEVIRHWHKDPPPRGEGWSDIGYHYVICNRYPTYRSYKHPDEPVTFNSDGLVQYGRDARFVGAHEQKYNRKSIGVCLIGRGPQDFTERQIAALHKLVHELRLAYEVPVENVLGHAEVDSGKRDPGFDMREFRRNQAQYTTTLCSN